MSRTTFENALWAWVQTASGYAASNVVWRDGKWDRPSGAFIELRLGPLQIVGQDWVEVEPGDDEDDDAVVTARGQRTTELRLEAFAGPRGAADGDTSPDGVLAIVMAKARLPSIREALYAGGVGLAGFGPVQTLDGKIGEASAEPRGLLTVMLHLESEVSEFASFIETVLIQQVDADGDPIGDEIEVG